jgi:hypothetical protein
VSDELIKCLICGAEMSTITWKHLSKHSTTLPEYKLLYPTAVLKSTNATNRKREAAIRSNSSRKGVPRSLEVVEKIKQTKLDNPTQAWNKGIPRTVEQNIQLSNTRKERFSTGQITHWNNGNTTSTDTRQKIQLTALSQHRQYSEHSKQIRKITIGRKIDNGWIPSSTVKLLSVLSEEAINKLNSVDWLYEQHITNQRTVASMCVELGLHWKNSHKVVSSRLIKHGIEVQYWHQSSSQQQVDIERFLTEIGVIFEVKNRSLIKPYELDIYIPDKNIAIEYCGLYWHSSEYKTSNYHQMKYNRCADIGIRLITIFSDEWLNNSHLVKNTIRTILGYSEGVKINGRSCVITVPNKKTKSEFFDSYHIQGDGPGSTTYGLTYGGNFVAMMTFINKGEGNFVLNRYATIGQVRGGFSKLLSHFKNNNEWATIISFADLRWSVGTIYGTNGFVLDKITPPDYQYVIGECRVHKFNYRHKNLPNLLKTYDPNLSEVTNTHNNNIHQIYNCGLQRWVLTK